MNDMSGQPLADVALSDRFDLSKTHVLLNGAQAVARLLLMQKARDAAAGLNTGGFVTGYRGSPVGGLDLQFTRLKKEFSAADIHFEPGLNEELAATALWGAQQAEMRGEGRFDGVFGLWYGKGPGVDRSGDVLRHANLAGTSKHGGVLALMGDDHTAEILDHRAPVRIRLRRRDDADPVAGRRAGDPRLWRARLCAEPLRRRLGRHQVHQGHHRIDGGGRRAASTACAPSLPADYKLPPGGLNIRTPDPILEQEARLQDHKRDAMVAWLAANGINRTIFSGGAAPKIGIITAGKSYLDVRQALDDLGLDEARCDELGVRLFKLGCTWPVVPAEIHAFAQGLDLIIVVEEKRSLIEVQVREELYGVADAADRWSASATRTATGCSRSRARSTPT